MSDRIATGEELRDESLAQVEDNRQEEADNFETALLAIAECGKPFTSDDILEYDPSLESVAEKRVFGSVFMRLCKLGLITPLGYKESHRRASHSRPKRVWILTSAHDG